MLCLDRFSVGLLSDDQGETIVRFRSDIPTKIRNLLPRQFIVEWAFQEAGANGLPASHELAESKKFGDEICSSLEADDDALLAFVATGNCVREWYFYCRDPLRLQVRLNGYVCGRSFPIQLHGGHDPAWQVYSLFTSRLEGG